MKVPRLRYMETLNGFPLQYHEYKEKLSNDNIDNKSTQISITTEYQNVKTNEIVP